MAYDALDFPSNEIAKLKQSVSRRIYLHFLYYIFGRKPRIAASELFESA